MKFLFAFSPKGLFCPAKCLRIKLYTSETVRLLVLRCWFFSLLVFLLKFRNHSMEMYANSHPATEVGDTHTHLHNISHCMKLKSHEEMQALYLARNINNYDSLTVLSTFGTLVEEHFNATLRVINFNFSILDIFTQIHFNWIAHVVNLEEKNYPIYLHQVVFHFHNGLVLHWLNRLWKSISSQWFGWFDCYKYRMNSHGIPLNELDIWHLLANQIRNGNHPGFLAELAFPSERNNSVV